MRDLLCFTAGRGRVRNDTRSCRLRVTVASLSLSLLMWPQAQSAEVGDPLAGKSKAVVCASCHGADGYSQNPVWPNLAGQQQQYLAKQLRAFREGSRSDPLMAPMAKSLSDQEIEDLAAYYASLP